MSLSKLRDAINDPVIGVIIDKSRSPRGVYRPWLIRMMIPFALSNILLWLPIGHWSVSYTHLQPASFCMFPNCRWYGSS